MKTINLYGYFGFKNIGDDLMLMNFLDYIDLNCTQKIRVRVFCNKDYYISKKYNKIEVNFIKLNFIKNNILMPYYILTSFEGYWIGGTCLYEPDSRVLSGLVWLHSLVKKYKKLKKEFSFINIGIGALYSKKAKQLVKEILVSSKKLSFREESSLVKAQQLHNSNNGILGGDMVFLNSKSFSGLEDHPPKNYLGFAGHSQYEDNTLVVEYYSNLLNNLSKDYKKIIFISMHGSEDHNFHMKIAEQIQIDCLFVEYKEYIKLFQKMKEIKFLIGMRLHSIVLADLLAIPNIGVTYGEKVSHYIEKTEMLANRRIKHINENITLKEINYIIDNYKYNKKFILSEEAASKSGIKSLLMELISE